MCGRRYQNKSSLKRHKRMECGIEPRYQCPWCAPKVYYKCSCCKKTYRHLTNMRRHERYECGRKPQYHCDFCDEGYAERTDLNDHYYDRHWNVMADFKT
ncbi:hypothetical protein GWI33_014882 [Rhynchophorus ferrugineus]|uniref:C2H2-type domain-containing protein n=1 Tax=Rhynchophorus ferrugineus TaxID=354439 RepID=A0A834I676_RHYFE|nr:hypothetical protein GWI33_014882 [Rhynchophorus ferrugineus]